MLIIDQNLLEIDNLLEKIMDEFLKFPEVEAYQKAKADFMADENLQSQLKTLEDNSEYIAFRPELRALQHEINLNEKVYAFRLAENDLQQRGAYTPQPAIYRGVSIPGCDRAGRYPRNRTARPL